MKVVIAALVALLILSSSGVALIYPTEERTITIKDKWIKGTSSESGQKYLVSDTEGNVYSVQDAATRLQWDASDRYAAIEAGKTYRVTIYGWRVRFLSMYQNIVEIEEA